MPEHSSTRCILDWLHALMAGGSAPSLDALLIDLARNFGAARAGLSGPLDAAADQGSRPWVDQPALLTALRKGGVHEAAGPAGTSLLLAMLSPPEGSRRVLWLEARAGRVWSEAEKASLGLAILVLARHLPAAAEPGEPPAILDQERIQERLQDAAIMAGRVAHAFDNVLTGILGFAELSLSLTSDATLHQYLGEVLQAAQNGTQLTQQLHLFHRCASVGTGPTRLAYVIADEEMRQRQALDGQITLTVLVPNDLPAVALDGEPLRHVLGHLLDNARESLNGKGEVTLTARRSELDLGACRALYGSPRPGPCVEITIADSGGGLSAETRRRLFREPFVTTKPRHRGLGLAVVYRILSAHHGGFQIEPGPRGGTVARVCLPLTPARPAT